jgi:ribonuclease-3
LAQKIGLGNYLLLGEGERKSGGFRRPSILADAMESGLGAIFLDAGFLAVEQVVLNLYIPYMKNVDVQALDKDAKTLLQEYLQSKRLSLPVYTVLTIQGEAHAQSFQVECAIQSLKISARGVGASRRNAEQQAALAAYHVIFCNPSS